MSDPALVAVTRGGIVESLHTGAFAVVGRGGRVLASAGDIAHPVFPRSAIKAFQCLPLVESGTADRFGLTAEEISLACASHNGEPRHVEGARSVLAKAGLDETALECGAHWPVDQESSRALVRAGEAPRAVHNNCSGKHAGMLALARGLGAGPAGYVGRAHPVQQAVARALAELSGADVEAAPCGVDGCSVPTWAIPIRNMASAFQKFGSGEGMSDRRRESAARIVDAVAAHPFMVAGTGRFCTRLMTEVPRAFVKTGAEGVFCATVPHAGIGIALKCDDGASRASEIAMAAILAALPVWDEDERAKLAAFVQQPIRNWNGIHTGDVAPVAGAFDGVVGIRV